MDGGCWRSAAVRTGDADAAVALVPVARGHHGESWAERRLAVLLLEHHLLQLPPDDLHAFDLVLTALGLKPRPATMYRCDAEVLDQGFSTTVARRLRSRARSTAWPSQARPPAGPAIRRRRVRRGRYFLRAARDVSKLTLARYVFSPDEVVREIERTLLVTAGAEHAAVAPQTRSGASARAGASGRAPLRGGHPAAAVRRAPDLLGVAALRLRPERDGREPARIGRRRDQAARQRSRDRDQAHWRARAAAAAGDYPAQQRHAGARQPSSVRRVARLARPAAKPPRPPPSRRSSSSCTAARIRARTPSSRVVDRRSARRRRPGAPARLPHRSATRSAPASTTCARR